MNDYLLESRQIQKKPDLISAKSEFLESQKIASTIQNAPSGNSTAFKILMIDQQAKVNVSLNNICVILFLTLLAFLGMWSTFPNVSWFLMVETPENNYWVNMIFIQKQCPACANSKMVYTRFLITFYLGGCEGETADLCEIVTAYAYSGLVASISTLVGLGLHGAHIYQLIKIILSRDHMRIKGFSAMTIAYFTLFLYVGSFLYWLFASATVINKNTLEGTGMFDRFGVSFYFYFSGTVIFLILVFWFQRVYNKGIRKTLVNNLLNAEKKYIDQVRNHSNAEDSSPSAESL